MAIDCKPRDERTNRQYETYQHQAISAILERSTLDRFCFLTRLTTSPGNPRPEELAFAVKGLLRCNFRQAADGLAWRRLFGTTKKRWHKKDWKSLPLSWRSRVLFQTFPDKEKAKNFLQCCPLKSWSAANACPHLDALEQHPDKIYYVLLQAEDVELNNSQLFSSLLLDFLKSNGSVFPYIHDARCPSLSGQAVPASPFPSRKTTRITWQLEPITLVHTGVSQDFAKAFFGQQREPHSRNLRLSCPASPKQLTSALLVSSLKGVWRAALAWLLERLAWEHGWADRKNPLTADYWQEQEEDFQRQCPVRTLLGGPLSTRAPGAGVAVKTKEAAAKGLITFTADPGSYLPGQVRENWREARFRFARKLLNDQQRDQALLQIETIDLGQPNIVTTISPGPHATAALLALCLAADLVSAGFFRLGRFTSRGFGIVRLRPRMVEQGTLIDFLEGKQQILNFNEDLSGFELAQRMDSPHPLGQLAAWLQNFSPPAQEEG